jgi:hypothetical protein
MNNDEATNREALVEALEAAGCTVKGRSATCPWHEDTNPSAQISAPNGHWRITCFKCDKFGDVFDIRAHTGGRPLKDILPKPEGKPMQPRPKQAKTEDKPLILADKKAVVAYAQKFGEVFRWYTYGPKDAPELIVSRIHTAPGKKTFRQFTPMGDGTYAAKNLREKGTIPLYRQDELAGHDRVLVVEGEKSADAAWDLGIPATTSCMGASKFDWTDWKALAGKQIVLWPDNDEIGAKHMSGVAEILGALGCASMQRIDPDGIGLSEGGDIADLVQAFGQATEHERQIIVTLMNDADHIGASTQLDHWHQQVYDGKWRNLDWPLSALGRLARATMPGSMTLLCADPGAGKSWMLLQLMRFWNAQGHRAVVRMFEDDMKAHLARLLGQMTGNGRHTDDAWVAENRAVVEEDKRTFRAELDLLGARIVPESREIWTHDDLAEWVERHAKAGARVIMVDPITALKSGREPWLQDFELAMRLKDIAYRYECSIILTTHPRGTAREPSLAGMAGGVAWPRFSHCVLWLETHRDPVGVDIVGGEGAMINRTCRILKCRHGKGSGASIGLTWGNDVVFREMGLISTAAKPKTPPRPAAHTEPRNPKGEAQRMADADDLAASLGW